MNIALFLIPSALLTLLNDMDVGVVLVVCVCVCVLQIFQRLLFFKLR